MNPEELIPYYKALKPFIDEKMGSWRDRDMYYDLRDRKIKHICYDSHLYNHPESISKKAFLRIPLTIDPVNPERGLSGMLDSLDKTGFWSLHCGGKRFAVEDYEAKSPTLAILKALCAQEGIEVKP